METSVWGEGAGTLLVVVFLRGTKRKPVRLPNLAAQRTWMCRLFLDGTRVVQVLCKCDKGLDVLVSHVFARCACNV